MSCYENKIKAHLLATILCLCLVSHVVAGVIQTDQRITVRKSDGLSTAVKQVKPTYPPLAKAARVSGVVVVEVTVSEDGHVISATAVSGHPLLRDAAVSAARLWQFTPTVVNGKPVKVNDSLTFSFTVDDSAEPAQRRPGGAEQEIKAAQVAVDTNPGSALAHFNLGEAYLDAQRYEQAIGSFKMAIQLKPDYEDAHSSLADTYHELGRYDDEIQAYQFALAVLPKSTEFLSGLAAAFAKRERFIEAIDTQKRLIELQPDNTGALAMLGWFLHRARRYEDAVEAYNEVIARHPNDANTIFNLGAAYFTMGRLDQALGAYQQSLEVSPPYHSPGRAHLQISVVLTRLGRGSEAIETGRKAIERDPTLIDGYCTLASTYSSMRRYQEALDVINDGLKVKPVDESLQVTMGNIYLRLGNAVGAEKAYRDSLRANPTSPNGQFGLATALTRQNKFSEAETILRKSIALSPRNTNALVLLGNVLGEQGKKVEAETEFRKALEFEPNNALVLNNLGYSMVERGANLEEALKMIQRAVNVEPGNAAYLDSLGLAYFKLGRLAEAEEPLLEAARQFPDNSTVHEHLGDLYAGQGKTDYARASWQKALSLSTQTDEGARLKSKLAQSLKK